MPRHSRPSRDTARSHTPDAPRAIDSAAACSEVPAVLPRPGMFFNGLASARQYARARPPAQCRPSATPLPHDLPLRQVGPAPRGIISPHAKDQPAGHRAPRGAGQLPDTRPCLDAWHVRLPAASGVTSAGREPQGASPAGHTEGNLTGIRNPS